MLSEVLKRERESAHQRGAHLPGVKTNKVCATTSPPFRSLASRGDPKLRAKSGPWSAFGEQSGHLGHLGSAPTVSTAGPGCARRVRVSCSRTARNTHQRVEVSRARQAVAARGAVLAAFCPDGRQEPGAERQQPSAESQEPRHGLRGERTELRVCPRAQRGPGKDSEPGSRNWGEGASSNQSSRDPLSCPPPPTRGTAPIASRFPSGPCGPEPGAAPGTGSLQGRILEGTTETKFESPGARGVATLTRVTYKERKKVGRPHAMQRGIKRSWLRAPNPRSKVGFGRVHSRCRCSGHAGRSWKPGPGRLSARGEPGKRAGLTLAVLGVAAAAAQRRVSGLASLPRRPGCGGRSHFIIRPGAQEASAPQSPAGCC